MVKLIRKVPDGGWGWVVVFGAAMANMGNQALVSVFGLAYGEEIKKTSYGIQGVALVMNINCMVTNFSGLMIGPILKTCSPRVVTAVGVLLTAGGLILSSFATSILHFVLTYSVCTGLGLGLIMPASFMAINSYFDKRKGHAVGLAMAGTGIGQTLMPQVVTLLLDKYEYAGTTLIMGAISLHGLVGALLFQPVEKHMRVCTPDEEEEIVLLQNSHSNIQPYNDCNDDTTGKPATAQKTNRKEKDKISAGGGIFSRISNALDLGLLKDPIFSHIIVGLSIVYTSSIAFSMLFPFHLQQIGLTRSQTAWSMSSLSAADIVARLTIPRVASKLGVGYRTTFLFGALMLALCRSLLAIQSTFETALAASMLCGYVRAATVINQNLTVSEYCEFARKPLPSALGLNMVAKGILVLTLGQYFAWVRDYSGSYVTCIQIQSACLLLVVLTWGGEMLRRKLTTPTTTAATIVDDGS